MDKTIDGGLGGTALAFVWPLGWHYLLILVAALVGTGIMLSFQDSITRKDGARMVFRGATVAIAFSGGSAIALDDYYLIPHQIHVPGALVVLPLALLLGAVTEYLPRLAGGALRKIGFAENKGP